jgi:hypothetical protein
MTWNVLFLCTGTTLQQRLTEIGQTRDAPAHVTDERT